MLFTIFSFVVTKISPLLSPYLKKKHFSLVLDIQWGINNEEMGKQERLKLGEKEYRFGGLQGQRL